MEDEEIKELLEKNLETNEEVLSIVKGMRRDIWYRRLFTTIKWLAVLGVLAWGYTQIQPHLSQLLEVLTNIQDLSGNLPF